MTRDELFEELAEKCPAWAEATVLLKDAEGRIAGYGYLERSTGRVTFSSSVEAVRFLSSSPPATSA